MPPPIKSTILSFLAIIFLKKVPGESDPNSTPIVPAHILTLNTVPTKKEDLMEYFSIK